MWKFFRNLIKESAPKTCVFWHFSLFGVAKNNQYSVTEKMINPF